MLLVATILCSSAYVVAQEATSAGEGEGGGGLRAPMRIGNHGPNCQRLRVQSPSVKEPKGNDMVVYCPSNFPWVMHCATIGTEAGTDKTDISDKCESTGKCSAVGLRKNTGPQNQAIEIVQKAVVRHLGSSGVVTGCWVYDFDHVHLPYTTEVVCCR